MKKNIFIFIDTERRGFLPMRKRRGFRRRKLVIEL